MPKLTDNIFFKKRPIRRVTQKKCLKNYVKYHHPKLKFSKKKKMSWEEKKIFKKKYNLPNFYKKESYFHPHRNINPIMEGYKIGNLTEKGENVISPSHDFGQTYFYNEFNNIEIIPNDYIEVKLTDKELMGKQTNYACKNPSKKIINLEKKGLNHENWVLHNRKDWLTIADIEKMKKGDQIKVLLLDRNVMDIVTENVKCNKIYKPTEFYKKSWVIYTYNKPTDGTIQLYYEIEKEKKNKKITKNNKNKKNNSTLENNRNTPFEIDLEINYKEGSWYPLRKGYLPAKDENWKTNLLDGKKKKWTTFPKDTPIGFRGPMILWDKLDKLPNIYLLDLE